MNHIHLNVPDVAEARQFFERYFDYTQVYPGACGRLFLLWPRGL